MSDLIVDIIGLLGMILCNFQCYVSRQVGTLNTHNVIYAHHHNQYNVILARGAKAQMISIWAGTTNSHCTRYELRSVYLEINI